jgi:hypothetical protein
MSIGMYPMSKASIMEVLSQAIGARNAERWKRGEPPIDEMILSPETYERLILETNAANLFYHVVPLDEPVFMGVRIKRMGDE